MTYFETDKEIYSLVYRVYCSDIKVVQWRIQDFPEGGRQLFTVSTYERHITSLHNQQAKTSHVIFM